MDHLRYAVIHSLEKEAQSNLAHIRPAQGPLDVNIPQVRSLAEQLAKLVGKDGSTVYWGQFGANNRQGQFPGSVEMFSADRSLDIFMGVSEVAMAELVQAARQEPLATGGYVCFIVYDLNGATFLLIAMIKERGALTLTEELVPTDIKEIDLSKLHQAARVNLDRYSEFLDAGEEPNVAEGPERTYLCFINRSQRNEVAKYFIEALGCEKGVSSARTTKNAVESVKRYFNQSAETKGGPALAARRAVIDHLHALPDGAEITITTIVNVARIALGEDLAPHADGLAQYLNGDDVQIPEKFPVSAKALDSLRKIKAQGTGWQMTFDDGALGEVDAEIEYNRQEQSIKVRRLPADAIRKIEDTLDQRRR